MKFSAWADCKEGKIRRFTDGRVCSEDKAKGVAEQPFASALDGSKDESVQLHMWLYERLDSDS